MHLTMIKIVNMLCEWVYFSRVRMIPLCARARVRFGAWVTRPRSLVGGKRFEALRSRATMSSLESLMGSTNYVVRCPNDQRRRWQINENRFLWMKLCLLYSIIYSYMVRTNQNIKLHIFWIGLNDLLMNGRTFWKTVDPYTLNTLKPNPRNQSCW